MLADLPTVLGREKELAALRTFLDDVPRGPRALLLEGEPGIGKTTQFVTAKLVPMTTATTCLIALRLSNSTYRGGKATIGSGALVGIPVSLSQSVVLRTCLLSLTASAADRWVVESTNERSSYPLERSSCPLG
jgi:hypothetical protein